ncbi:hypothetical protein E2C01_094909 [Portunus trituberculatus]|uniref:Uncharacterized protein n=1 Tax=Portunus trituberculatus TaxID=210409 RepID=A0A5B7JYG4_PORTR|nr:hypothetical protein [Portunus trituberculatus]
MSLWKCWMEFLAVKRPRLQVEPCRVKKAE